MDEYAGRLYVSDLEMQLEPTRDLVVGDIVEVIRGNGPREGDRMGTATITGFKDGIPALDVRFDGGVGTE